MFRKPKRNSKKPGIRKRSSEEDGGNVEVNACSPADLNDEEEGDDNMNALMEARTKQSRLFKSRKKPRTVPKKAADDDNDASALHHFQPSENRTSQKDLVTSTTQHHPTCTKVRANKLLAGPIRAASNIRTTCRFDYQPDICKDYKDTGFCGFGDSCIYLHDRGDQLSGWQLDQKWEEEQKKKKDSQQMQVEQFLKNSEEGGKQDKKQNQYTDDGLPFACHLCRSFFTNPVKTNCNHYFCEKCLLDYMKESGALLCSVCSKDTSGVYHEPTKLLSKKRRLVGRNSSWETFMLHCQGQVEVTQQT